MGHTKTYFQFSPTIEVQQMLPFHNKLLDVGKLKTITLLLILTLEP